MAGKQHGQQSTSSGTTSTLRLGRDSGTSQGELQTLLVPMSHLEQHHISCSRNNTGMRQQLQHQLCLILLLEQQMIQRKANHAYHLQHQHYQQQLWQQQKPSAAAAAAAALQHTTTMTQGGDCWGLFRLSS